MRKKTTIELVEQGEISEAITLTGALKARFHLECASSSDLRSKANRLRNLESSLGNKLMAIMTFARDDKESVAIGKMIDELLKDEKFLKKVGIDPATEAYALSLVRNPSYLSDTMNMQKPFRLANDLLDILKKRYLKIGEPKIGSKFEFGLAIGTLDGENCVLMIAK